jgi:hypothetical protein
MPKVNIRKTSSMDRAVQSVHRDLRQQLTVKGLCKYMGYSPNTDTDRVKHPEDFTIRQLRIMYKLSDMGDEAFLKMIRDKPK